MIENIYDESGCLWKRLRDQDRGAFLSLLRLLIDQEEREGDIADPAGHCLRRAIALSDPARLKVFLGWRSSSREGMTYKIVAELSGPHAVLSATWEHIDEFSFQRYKAGGLVPPGLKGILTMGDLFNRGAWHILQSLPGFVEEALDFPRPDDEDILGPVARREKDPVKEARNPAGAGGA